MIKLHGRFFLIGTSCSANKQKTWKIPCVGYVWLCHMKWAPIHNSTAFFRIFFGIFSCIRLKLEAFLFRFFANFHSISRMHFTHDNQFKLNTYFFFTFEWEKNAIFIPFVNTEMNELNYDSQFWMNNFEWVEWKKGILCDKINW